MKRCFIISPIGEEGSDARRHADFVYYFIIKPALDEYHIEGVRSDHLNEPGKISEQMFREILEDDLCIAVLTGHNPNVFYELAVAQSAARPVILLIQKGEKLPFDVKDLRYVEYELEPKGLLDRTYVKRVAEHIQSLEAMNWRVANPLGELPTLTAVNYSLYIGPPEKIKDINVKSLMRDIEWDNENCYLVNNALGLREKISLMPSISSESFEVEIERKIAERIRNRPVELDLKDKKGNSWKVRAFYLFRSLQPLLPVESPEKIAADYGEDEE